MTTPAVTSGGRVGEVAKQVAATVPTPADQTRKRRACRVCRRPNARPIVPIGSSRHWDLCARCAGVVTRREPVSHG